MRKVFRLCCYLRSEALDFYKVKILDWTECDSVTSEEAILYLGWPRGSRSADFVYIYAIDDGDSAIKFGKAALRYGPGFKEFRLIAVMLAGAYLETLIHKALERSLIGGDRFRADDDSGRLVNLMAV